MMDALHFIRPLWLLSIPVIFLLWWLVRRREARHTDVAPFVAPHLRDALTINRDATRGIQAIDANAVAMLLLAIAAAGPAWSKQVAPWFEETAPLVVAVEVSDSMRSNDLLPTRLDRARFKVQDLIGARTGARTALIAYAGSAHIVMPPTTDNAVLDVFLESLDPAIMPDPGNDAAAVLPVARQLLGEDAAISTLLFVNDGFDHAAIPALAAFSAEPGAPALAALVVGTDAGGVALLPDGSPVHGDTGGPLDTRIDTGALHQAARDADISIVRAETGDDDIQKLVRTIASNLKEADDPGAEWLDQGWLVLWPALLLALSWFRRGWTMRW